jgi:probable HAF family extracellular repeat protein
MISRLRIAVASMVLLSSTGSAGAASQRWTIHDLGTLPAPFNFSSDATAINARGVVIGWSATHTDQQRAFVWQAGKMRALPGFGGFTEANAIADDGDIAGEGLYAHQTHHHAILWHDGKLIDLGTLGGRLSAAEAINDHGQVVGNSTTAAGQDHAFLWQKGSMTDLGTLGGTNSHAVAINEAGQVIGTSTTASGATHAFLWQHGTLTDLGSLPGEESVATAIADDGEIVGYLHPSIYDPDHAVRWRNSKLADLGAFGSQVKQAIAINAAGQILVSTFRPDVHAFLWHAGQTVEIGRRYTNAHGLNDHGFVVGTARFHTRGPQIPFVWHDGTMTALPTLTGTGPPYSAASHINNRNWIVGSSYTAAGGRAVLWVPG